MTNNSRASLHNSSNNADESYKKQLFREELPLQLVYPQPFTAVTPSMSNQIQRKSSGISKQKFDDKENLGPITDSSMATIPRQVIQRNITTGSAASFKGNGTINSSSGNDTSLTQLNNVSCSLIEENHKDDSKKLNQTKLSSASSSNFNPRGSLL